MKCNNLGSSYCLDEVNFHQSFHCSDKILFCMCWPPKISQGNQMQHPNWYFMAVVIVQRVSEVKSGCSGQHPVFRVPLQGQRDLKFSGARRLDKNR